MEGYSIAILVQQGNELKNCTAFLFAAACLGNLAVIPVTAAESPASSLRSSAEEAALVSQARKEGQLTVYLTDFAPNEAVVRGFEKKYPFLKIRPVPFGGPNLIDSFERGSQGPKNVDAVMRCEAPFVFASWFQKGWLESLAATRGYDQYPPWAKGAEGAYVRFAGFQHGIIYNSRLTSAKELPASYMDLLRPEWAQRFFLPVVPGYGHFFQVFMRNTNRISWDVLSGRGIAQPSIERMMGAVAEGSTPLFMGREIDRLDWRKKYPDLSFHPMKEAPYQYAVVALVANRPHPAAGQLFAKWVLSDEARKIMDQDMGGRSFQSPNELASKGLWTIDVNSYRTFPGGSLEGK